ncbi:YraN family protein [Peterkaempfera sp. SMS 1(5)a]|uniref:YraN family protein n=1 Tax=Peterkaempfera podocarpi TaxID=3232308 RepID=UPI00366D38C7
MSNPRTALGRYGEEVAARRLTEAGLTVLERNWRCREGELDIVALEGDVLAVCEVKTRHETGFQQPCEAVSRAKAERLRRLAERWLDERWPVHRARLHGAPARIPRHQPGGCPAPGPVQGGPAARGPVPPPTGGVRIDLIAVIGRRRGAALVEHLRGVV